MTLENGTPMRRRDALGLLATGTLGLPALTRAGRVLGREHHGNGDMKTIGVLGGIGPQATMDFETRVHRAAQRLIPPRQNSGYPPMLVYYHRRPPILLNGDGTPRFPIAPDPQLLEAAGRLGSWVDFLVITSNGAHLVQEPIEQSAGRRVLSMVDTTLQEVQRRGWQKVGVVGLGYPIVYTTPLARMKIAFETIDSKQRGLLDKQIMKVMEGQDSPESVDIARDAIGSLRARKVDGIILGCTEIPFLLPGNSTEPDLIDPLELLAEAAVNMARGAGA